MILVKNVHENITIIGAGALGCNLALALFQQNYSISGVFNRSVLKAQKLADLVQAKYHGEFPQKPGELGDIIFLCVPDDQLKKVSRQFVDNFDDLAGKCFIHCSGARPASEIGALKPQKALIASFHPVQTFVNEPQIDVFKNANISLQGDARAVEKLKNMAHSLGAVPFVISEGDKLLLHIAAVFACNYMVTISRAAALTLSQTSDPKSITLDKLVPLMEQTLQNIKKIGPEQSLSGPLKRGDIDTIRKHLDTLENQPDLKSLYKNLGRFTAKNIMEMKPDGSDRYNELLKLFVENGES